MLYQLQKLSYCVSLLRIPMLNLDDSLIFQQMSQGCHKLLDTSVASYFNLSQWLSIPNHHTAVSAYCLASRSDLAWRRTAKINDSVAPCGTTGGNNWKINDVQKPAYPWVKKLRVFFKTTMFLLASFCPTLMERP